MKDSKVHPIVPCEPLADFGGHAPRGGNFWKRISESQRFQNSTFAVILLNAGWIAVDVEFNHSALMDENGKFPLEPYSVVVEQFFCVYFTLELLARFLGFNPKGLCCLDGWFVFDTSLVSFMLMENWFIPLVQYALEDDGGGSALGSFNMLRLLRLLRLTRVARLMRYNPELLVMVKGMIRATRAVFYVLIFLVLVMYVCAIIFTSTLMSDNQDTMEARRLPEAPVEVRACEEEEDPPAWQLFSSIAMSMLSLLTHGVLGDNLAQAASIIANESPLLFWVFFAFFIFTALTLYNMLLGILCEVINRTQEEEQESATITEVKDTLLMAFQTLDKTHDGLVSEVEWNQIKTDKAVVQALCRLGIDEDKIDLKLDKMQQLLFGVEPGNQDPADDGCRPSTGEFADKGLTFEDFVEKVFELREDTSATALDLERCKMQTDSEERELREHLLRVGGLVERLTTKKVVVKERAEGMRQSTAEHLQEDEETFLRSISTEKLLCVLRQRGDSIGTKQMDAGATEPLSLAA